MLEFCSAMRFSFQHAELVQPMHWCVARRVYGVFVTMQRTVHNALYNNAANTSPKFNTGSRCGKIVASAQPKLLNEILEARNSQSPVNSTHLTSRLGRVGKCWP
jgi:hypothetical protein